MLIALKSNGRPQSSNIAYTMGAGDVAARSGTTEREPSSASVMLLRRECLPWGSNPEPMD